MNDVMNFLDSFLLSITLLSFVAAGAVFPHILIGGALGLLLLFIIMRLGFYAYHKSKYDAQRNKR